MRWRAFGAMTLVTGSCAAVFASSVSPVSGEGPVEQVVSVGFLGLTLGNTSGAITFTPTGASAPTVTQAITVNAKCGAATSGPLATVTSVGGSQGLGLLSQGVGVRQKNTCSSAEGQINGAENLTIALGPTFGTDVFVADAELDIEGKHSASMDVSLDGAAVVNRALVNASDNGPDSGVGDNDRVFLSADQTDVERFRAMTLSAHAGEVSLEGGGDGSYTQYVTAGKVGPLGLQLRTAATILRLVSVHEFAGDLSCGETRNAAVIGGSASEASVTRLENDGDQACEDVGVTLEIRDEGVFLDKGTTGLDPEATPQAVNATARIVWTAQPTTMPLPAREINLDPDNPASPWKPVQWCGPFDTATQTWTHPAGVAWCLLEDHVELQGDGTAVQTQVYDGDGDPMWR